MDMNILKLLTRQNIPQWVLATVCILYILGDITPPHAIADHVTTPIGIFVLISILLFFSLDSFIQWLLLFI
jgi:uncharacterized membrane protein YcaP (DUF421 family)